MEPGGDFHAASVLSSPVSCQPVRRAGCQQGPLALPAPVTSLPMNSEDTLVPCCLLSLCLDLDRHLLKTMEGYIWAGGRLCGEGELGQGTAILSQGQLGLGSLILKRAFRKEAGQQGLVHSASKVVSKMADFLRSP